MSRPARDGTAEPVSRDQILRPERGQGNLHFFCSADHVQDWQPYPVDPYSCYMCDYTYIYKKFGNAMKKSSKGKITFFAENVTIGYTLVKTRHSRVPTYLQRETDTADWSTPTFTLPCPNNGGVYPATSTFLQNCTPIFRNVP